MEVAQASSCASGWLLASDPVYAEVSSQEWNVNKSRDYSQLESTCEKVNRMVTQNSQPESVKINEFTTADQEIRTIRTKGKKQKKHHHQPSTVVANHLQLSVLQIWTHEVR